MDSLATFIIAALIAAAFAAVVVTSIRNRKKGKCSCACGCGKCEKSGCDSCGENEIN